MRVEKIKIKLIEANPYQTRKSIDKNSLKALIKSIRENGLINPINILKNGSGYSVLSGHRRLECYKKMRKEVIPCIIRKGKAGDFKINMAHENLLRDDLQPIEKAETIKLLIADKIKTTKNDTTRMCQLISKLKNWKKRGDCKFERLEGFKENDIFIMQDVLKSLNLSENNAVVYLSILSLPKKIQDAISWRKGQIFEEGKIKLAQAEQLSRVKDIKYQDYLFNRCYGSRLTKERIRALVNNHIKEVESGEFKGVYKSAQVSKLKSDLDSMSILQDNLISTSKKINTFKATALQRLKETLEKQIFLSDVRRLKSELLMLLHQINEQLEEYGEHKTEKKSTTFNIEVLNENRFRNGNIIKGGKRFTFPRSEEHTSELQSHSFISYAVFCLKKKTQYTKT